MENMTSEQYEELASQRSKMYDTLKAETRARIYGAKAKMAGLHATYGAMLPNPDLLMVPQHVLDSIRGCEKAMQQVRIDLEDAQAFQRMLEGLYGEQFERFLDAEIQRRSDTE